MMRRLLAGTRTIWVITMVALSLPGCVPSAHLAQIQALDRAAEHEVDAVLGFVRERFCSLPVDVLARMQAADGNMGRALYYACPEIRSLTGAMWLELGRDRESATSE